MCIVAWVSTQCICYIAWVSTRHREVILFFVWLHLERVPVWVGTRRVQ